MDSEVLFRRLLAVSKQRDVNLEQVLSYELAPVPPSLFNDDGTMRKTTKADLSKKLEYNCDEIQVLAVSHNNHTAYIIDGMTILQALAESKYDTFNDLGLIVMQSPWSRIDTIVRYQSSSWNATAVLAERQRLHTYMSSVIGVGFQTTEHYEKRHKQISTGRVHLCILDRYGSTYHQGTPMAYAGRRFHQWPVGKGC